MTTISFRGGRLPERPDQPKLRLGPLLHKELPAPPASADWLTPVPAGAWGMLGNDQVGDCTCAGVGHMRIGDCFVNQNITLPVSTADTLALYSAITGYTPDDPDSDQGAVCQDVLDYWRKHGFLGEKITAFARVDLDNETEVKQAIALFGQLYVGIDVTQATEDQFNAGQPWDYVRGSRDLGGHCITVGAYDDDGLDGVTWAKVHRMTWRFLHEQGREAWVGFGPDDINPKTSADVHGLNLAALGSDFTALTRTRLAG